jgi:hypothetical protein
MINYEIIKTEKGLKMKGQDQDGNEQEVKVDKYTLKVKGIDRTLELMVRSDLGTPVEETIQAAVNDCLKNLPEGFKTKEI